MLCMVFLFLLFPFPSQGNTFPLSLITTRASRSSNDDRNKSSRVQAVLLGCANVSIPCFSLNMSSRNLSGRHVDTVPLMSPRILSSGSLQPAPPAPLGLGSSDPGSFLETSVLCRSRDPDSPGVWPNFTAL